MDDEKVHKPALPGVRTLTKDTGTDQADLTASGVVFSVPEKVVDAQEKIDHHVQGEHTNQNGKHVFDVARAFSDDTVQIGTIVTDRKEGRPGRPNVLVAAFTEWWGGARKKVASRMENIEFLKEHDTATVASPLVRTNIIQEAAQHAKQAPRDDHSHTVEKVRTFLRDAEVKSGKPFVVKPPVVTQSAWGTPPRDTPSRDVGEKGEKGAPVPVAPIRDLRQSMIAPVIDKRAVPPEDSSSADAYRGLKRDGGLKEAHTAVEVMKQRPSRGQGPKKEKGEPSWSFFSSQEEPLDLRDRVREIMPPALNEVSRHEEPEPPQVIPSRQELRGTLREVPPPPVPVPQAPTPIPVPSQSVSTPEPVQIPPRAPQQATPPPRTPPTRPISTATPPTEAKPIKDRRLWGGIPRFLLYGTIITVGGSLGVLVAVFVFRFIPELTTAPPHTIVREANFIISDVHLPVLFRDIGTVRTTLEQERTHTGRPYITADLIEEDRTGTTSLMSSDLMRILGRGAPASFVRSLRPEYALGITSRESADPFLILQSTSFDVAFAGMLSWEKTLSDDLAPFFQTTNLSAYTYRDALTSNRSIRILRDERDEERIVYAFVNKNIIIITTNTEALSRLLDRIRS